MSSRLINGFLLAMLAAFAPSVALAQAEPNAAERLKSQGSQTDRASVEKRLESVGTLLEKSSGARQVESSGNPAAAEKRAKAQEVYKQAGEAFKAGDYAKTSKLLGEASGLMFEAVRMSDKDKVAGDKAKTDYNARLESVKALLAAQKRITTEKPGAKGAADSARSIEKLMQDAEKQAAANNYVDARATLDKAYLVAKGSIGSMRDGDTLVRTLTFASKEEEYHYELDRNDTHQMLIKVLLEDKRSAETDKMVKGFVDKATHLRTQAESTASKGDYVGGIKLLEDSTAELVKAIRGAGIYIPG